MNNEAQNLSLRIYCGLWPLKYDIGMSEIFIQTLDSWRVKTAALV